MDAVKIKDELGTVAAEMRKVLDNKEGWSAAEVEDRFDKLNKRASELEHTAQELERVRRVEGLEKQVVRSAPLALASDKRRDVTASTEYRDAFWRYLKTGNEAEIRAISTGTTAIGVPQDLYRQMVERLYAPTSLLGRVNRISIDGDKKIAIGNAQPSANFINEAAAISGTDPTFSTQITVDPKKVVVRTQVSVEALADAIGNPDMQGYIMKQQAGSLQILLERAMVRGGITAAWSKGLADAPIDASTDVAVTGTYSAITGDNLIDAVHNVAPQYRTGNFFWVLDDTALKTIRKIKLSGVGNNEYLWKVGDSQDLTQGIPGTIYGIPYVITQQVDATVTAKARIIVGNFDYATLFERQGLEMVVDPYSNSANLQVNLYTYARYDFWVTVPEAFAGVKFSSQN